MKGLAREMGFEQGEAREGRCGRTDPGRAAAGAAGDSACFAFPSEAGEAGIGAHDILRLRIVVGAEEQAAITAVDLLAQTARQFDDRHRHLVQADGSRRGGDHVAVPVVGQHREAQFGGDGFARIMPAPSHHGRATAARATRRERGELACLGMHVLHVSRSIRDGRGDDEGRS